jgi:LEA14-like dessication related protein
MKRCYLKPHFVVLLTAVFLSSCAATGPSIEAPAISLADARVNNIELGGQSFLLLFAVQNPNPFPLPIKAVRYDIRVDDQKFAGGETRRGFVVPAGGDGEFAITIELDLMQSMSQLTTLLRGGLRENIHYQLHGSLAVDMPFVRPIPFSSSGTVRVRSGD